MILLLDTSTPTCKLTLIDLTSAGVENQERFDIEWEAGRGLAKGLLGFIQTNLEANGKNWNDISGLVAFKGPGSFTGLRIGIAVLNSLAYSRGIPIVGEFGEQWQQSGLGRLGSGESDGVVLPEYGGDANITKPRK
jgi:tRNA threonylcarbamoyl adenosine modification protein YeaZ